MPSGARTCRPTPSLSISSNPASVLAQNATHRKEEKHSKLLGDLKAVFVGTNILGESCTSQGRLGGKSQEVQGEASHCGESSFTAPGLQFSGEGRKKEGCRGKAAVIGILPHTGAGAIFGGKNRQQAFHCSEHPPCKLLTKTPKDIRRG